MDDQGRLLSVGGRMLGRSVAERWPAKRDRTGQAEGVGLPRSSLVLIFNFGNAGGKPGSW